MVGFGNFSISSKKNHHGQLPGAKVQDAIGEVGSAVASGWDAKGRMAISMDSDALGEQFPMDSDGLKGAQHGRSRGDRWK